MISGFKLGAKLPLYAFKRVNNGGGSSAEGNKEPPVAFLDSLIIGEVSLWSHPLVFSLPVYKIRVTYSLKKMSSGFFIMLLRRRGLI